MRPPTPTARGVVREIDRELERLEEYEKTVASQRELLLRARATLAVSRDVRVRQRVSTMELLKYVGKHTGCSVEQIAEALQARVTSVSAQLHRGRRVRYECREGGWHLRPLPV
jgi:DNA-directed RNA polymerase specialized sigma24 family protein